MHPDSWPLPDKNNIIQLLPDHLSETNQNCVNHLRFFSLLYDPAMKYIIRPRIHKADPVLHQGIWQESIGKVKDARILDIACGTGALIACMDPSNDYTGLDLSYTMLKQAARRAKKKGFSRHCLVQGNGEQQIFPSDSFDLVVTDTALHMIPDWRSALAEAAKSLIAGGRLVCAVPVLGIDESFDKGWGKYAKKPNFHALTREELKRACLDHGLDFSVQATNGGVLYAEACKG